jgi:hypothetical protein
MPDLTRTYLRKYTFLPFLLIAVSGFARVSQKPALIPEPKHVEWQKGSFDLSACRYVVFTDSTLKNEADFLKKMLADAGRTVSIAAQVSAKAPAIRLAIGRPGTDTSGEAYTLTVGKGEVMLLGRSPHAVFNAIQTFLQLIGPDGKLPACRIQDRPAFPWRGYMTDVGRNYMSVASLKSQIDVMARYKLNVFHFHATEDIAWRIQIREFPELTDARHMVRNKGSYYTVDEIRELIRYCKERHITFIPEIDMPGHSAAFRRAMGTDMQSDSGMRILKKVLTEVCETYDVPYIHIGADEVRITNPRFIPEMSRHIGTYGKNVIGWDPGGNFLPGTIRQLWGGSSSERYRKGEAPYLDSRQLYLNHMDPLESVVTVFNRRIGDLPEATATALGGILCTWHDRAAAREEDILRMNPVFPAMIAFAERSWKGGGVDGMLSDISIGDVAAFTEFEERLIRHKSRYFRDLPFPYVRQSDRVWDLYGPFPNGGQLSAKFRPEAPDFVPEKTKPDLQLRGATIILRHWWAPVCRGALQDPEDSSTWYAATQVWSDREEDRDCWIGFNNLSRSYRTNTPDKGTWDDRSSAVWVNGIAISPPEWKYAGQKGDIEIPLADEGYEYRTPAKVHMRKGWNTVLVKCPVGSFRSKDGNNPVKWMFTFTPLEGD